MRRPTTLATATAAAVLFSPGVAVAAPGNDFGITMQGPMTATAGEAFSYAISVSNTGRSKSTTTLTDRVPVQLTVQGVTTTAATCSTTGNDVSCTTAKLAPGEAATVTITVTAAQSGTVTNSAVLADDAETTNNTASVTTEVTAAATVPSPVTVTAPYDDAARYDYGYADRQTGAVGLAVPTTCQALFETLIRNYCSGQGKILQRIALDAAVARSATVTFTVSRAAISGDDPTAVVKLGLYVVHDSRVRTCSQELLGASSGRRAVQDTTVTVTCDLGQFGAPTSARVEPWVYGERTLDGVTVDVDAVVSSITLSP